MDEFQLFLWLIVFPICLIAWIISKITKSATGGNTYTSPTHAQPAPPQTEDYIIHLAGVTYGSRQQLIAGLYDGQMLHLEREPNNEHDANAIAVYSGSDQLGYMPRDYAAFLAPQFDAGKAMCCHVYRIAGYGFPNLGLVVEVNVQL